MTTPVLALEAARGMGESLPAATLNLDLYEGDFAMILVPGPRRGAGFANLCSGLTRLAGGRVLFLGRDWSSVPNDHADALRGHIGRLFHQPIRADTPDVAARILLARRHHTRILEATLRAQATAWALRFGLPGLPSGPARLLTEADLLRAACVRAFLGRPHLVILELAGVAQHTLLPHLLSAGAEVRSRGAAVIWLTTAESMLRDRAIQPTHRLRLSDVGLSPLRLTERAA